MLLAHAPADEAIAGLLVAIGDRNSGVRIAAPDRNGLRYGAALLEQIRENTAPVASETNLGQSAQFKDAVINLKQPMARRGNDHLPEAGIPGQLL